MVNYLLVALLFIALDFVFGVIKALITKTFESRKMREGLEKKISEIVILILGVLCNYAFPIVGITIQIPIVQTIAVYIILMELSSILENLGKCNPALGDIISKVFGGYFKTK